MAKKSKETVDQFMARLDHPLKAEVQALRDIIKGVSPNITEQIKWNAPSFSTTNYIVTFNLPDAQHVRLVFHNPAIASIQSDLLQGDYVDRRLAYFARMDDVLAKQAELQSVVRQLVTLMDSQAS